MFQDPSDLQSLLLKNSNINPEEHLFIKSELKKELNQYINQEVYLTSSLFILVQTGKITIELNRAIYTIYPSSILLLSVGHFFQIQSISDDFSCHTLYISQEYAEAMFSTDMLYKKVKYNVKMYRNPLLQLQPSEMNLLNTRFQFLTEINRNKEHLYRHEMSLNALRIFFLDLSHIIEMNDIDSPTTKPSMEEVYFQSFLNLVVKNYKTHHTVEYYAELTHITPHYLTIIVKKLSGQSVATFINQLLFSEAKSLLQEPQLSIQQIAEQLHFSDQSAFGKFFKRNSGVSPRSYRSANNSSNATPLK